jgi:hypothetical protein
VKKVIRTKTYTKTKTVPGYARRTTITVLVPRGTVTETMTKKATKTITITTTPVETITEVSTTTEVETTEATSTTTVCPVPSYTGADGVGVEWDDEGSNIEFPDIDFKDPVACCSLCYYNIPNCNVWAAGNEYCFIVAGGSGPGATDKCPNGQGGGILYVTPSTTRGLGGAGPCGGRMRIEE